MFFLFFPKNNYLKTSINFGNRNKGDLLMDVRKYFKTTREAGMKASVAMLAILGLLSTHCAKQDDAPTTEKSSSIQKISAPELTLLTPTSLGAYGGYASAQRGGWLRDYNGAINLKSSGASTTYFDKTWGYEIWVDKGRDKDFYYFRCPEWFVRQGLLTSTWVDANSRFWGWYDPNSAVYGTASKNINYINHLVQSVKVYNDNLASSGSRRHDAYVPAQSCIF